MKKNLLIFFIALLLLVISSCSNNEGKDNITEHYCLDDEYFDITLYGAEEVDILEAKRIIEYNYKLFNEKRSYDGLDNVYSLNEKRRGSFDSHFINDLKNIITSTFNDMKSVFLSKNIKEIWENACISNTYPSTDLISQELIKKEKSFIEFGDNYIAINGDANITFSTIKNRYILEKIKEYLEKKKISKYCISANSQDFLFGENVDNNGYFDVSPCNVKNGYIKIKNRSICVITSDYFNVLMNDGSRYSIYYDPNTGYSLPYYTRIISISDNSIVSSLASYNSFFTKNDCLESLENDYDASIIAYNWNNMVHNSLSLNIYAK